MTSPTRSDRSPRNSSRTQSSRQLLWIAAPRRGPDRSHGAWAMASPAPAHCGATATLRAFRICPWQTSFASPRTIWLADRGGGSVRENPLRSLHWELTEKQSTQHAALWGPGARPSACATTLMRLQVGPISSAITLMQPTSGSPTFRMGSVFSPPRRKPSTPPRCRSLRSWWAARMGLAKLHVPRIIENGKLQRTSCTQGSSLACPWLSRLSTGTPDSAKPWDADSCSFSFLSTSTMHTSPTGPRAKGPGSRPFGT